MKQDPDQKFRLHRLALAHHRWWSPHRRLKATENVKLERLSFSLLTLQLR